MIPQSTGTLMGGGRWRPSLSASHAAVDDQHVPFELMHHYMDWLA